MTSPAKRAGVVVRGKELAFLPVAAVVRIVPMPPVSRVPGSPGGLLGIAQEGGDIVPVVAADEAAPGVSTALLVCTHQGDLIGLAGLEVVQVGVFECDADGVRLDERGRVPLFDLAPIVERLAGTAWARRWAG